MSNFSSHLHPLVPCHLSPAELIDCIQPHPLNNKVLHHVVDKDDRDGKQSVRGTTVGDDLKVQITIAILMPIVIHYMTVWCAHSLGT